MEQYVLFQLNSQRFALPIQVVNRVVRACSVRSTPHSPSEVIGMIDLQGSIIPALSLRSLLRMEAKELDISDMMIICQVSEKQVALIVDHIENIESCEEKTTEQIPQVPMPESLEKFIQHKEDLVPVYHLEKILSNIHLEPAGSGVNNNE